MMTKIAWTDESWNPVTGCKKVSPGCAHCYIENTPPMRMAGRRFVDGKIPITLHPDRLDIPLHWRKPRMVFVPSMGDLFHEDVPDEFIDQVFSTMMFGRDRGHIFQVLTKRPKRMAAYVDTFARHPTWPFPNVWLGVSVENQARADERIPILLETPAAVRFVSAEPLLGPLDELYPWLGTTGEPSLDWVIVGGESGGPPERRLVERCGDWENQHMSGKSDCYCGCPTCQGTGWRPKPEALEWVRSLRDQCQAAGVPFYFKQWGPRAGQGTLLDGREHKEMPEVRA